MHESPRSDDLLVDVGPLLEEEALGDSQMRNAGYHPQPFEQGPHFLTFP